MKNKGKFKLTIILALISIILASICIIIRFKEDRTPPQIYFDDSRKTYAYDLTEEALLEDVSAVDNSSGDVSASLKVEKVYFDDNGNACVVYVAKDANNNVTKCLRVFPAEDSTGN